MPVRPGRTRVMLGLVVLVCAWANATQANMAKWWRDGEGYGPLAPQSDTHVRVDSEDLSFDVAPSLDRAQVTATYRLTSGDGTPSSADVAFVFVAAEGAPEAAPHASIAIDDLPVPFRVVTDDDLLAHATPEEVARLHDAWSTLAGGRHLVWLTFRLEVGASATRTVTVRYEHAAGDDTRQAVNTTFTYEYLLSPAKRWAGFGPLHLTIHLPPGTALEAAQSLVRDGDTYRADFPGLPEGELTFGVMSRKGLLFGMAQTTGYWLLLGALMLGVSLALSVRLGRAWAGVQSRAGRALLSVFGTGLAVGVAAGAAAALASVLMPQRALGIGYGPGLGLLFLLFVCCVAGIVTSAVSTARRRTRQP